MKKQKPIDLNPKDFIMQAGDEIEKRRAKIKAKVRAEARRKRRTAKREYRLETDLLARLGQIFYEPIAIELLARRPESFDGDGLPTEEAIDRALDSLAEMTRNRVLLFEDYDLQRVFHRDNVEKFAVKHDLYRFVRTYQARLAAQAANPY